MVVAMLVIVIATVIWGCWPDYPHKQPIHEIEANEECERLGMWHVPYP
jgi:hypothetical protein